MKMDKYIENALLDWQFHNRREAIRAYHEGEAKPLRDERHLRFHRQRGPCHEQRCDAQP